MALNDKSRTENVKRNAVFAIARKLTNVLLVFVGRRFFIKYIGIAYLGINGLFVNVLTLLSLAELGISTAMNVSLYKPIAEKDTHKLAAIIAYFRRIYVYIAIAVTVIGVALMPFLKYIVNMDQDIPHLYIYYLIFVLNNSITYLMTYKSSILFADQNMSTVSKIEIWSNLIKTLLQIIVTIVLKSYLLYLITDISYAFIRNLLLTHISNKEYPFLKEKATLDEEERKKIGSNIFSLFVYRISFVIINGTDNILISMLVGTVFVGFYSNYNAVSTNIESTIGLLFVSLTASIGNLVTTSDENSRYRIFRISQMATFCVCGIVCTGLLLLFQDFITLWVGNECLLDMRTVVAITIYLYYQLAMRPVWLFREGTGMYDQIKYVMLVTAFCNIVISIVLGKLIGLSGILFGTTIANVLTCFWFEPRILFKKFFNKHPSIYYRDHLINIILTGVGMVACYFATRGIEGVSVLKFIIKGVIIVAITGTIYLVRYCREPEFRHLTLKVMSSAKKLISKK